MPRPTPPPAPKPHPHLPRTTDDVDPRWLLKALGAVILLAAVCGYVTLCLLFYQGQWQLVLHPTRTGSVQPPIAGAELVHFAPDESAVPQLTGWWIPAAPASAGIASRYAQATLLFLPSGDGSLADSAPLLDALHNLGINLFAFDYRGYGQSAALHPNQKTMIEDAGNAWRYLTTSRGLAGRQIVPYGVGVGASLATRLAATHPETPALVLESPQADLLDAIRRDPRARLVPVPFLFHDDFPLAGPLSTLKTPKLLLALTRPATAFKTAAGPKTTVEFNAALGSPYAQPTFAPSLARFLDQYLPPTTPPLPMAQPPQP